MRVKRTIFMVFGLLLLIGPAMAADLTYSEISNSNSGWLIANDGTGTAGRTSTITVHVMEGPSSTNVANAHVEFSLSDATLGSLSPSFVDTGTDGFATTTFTTNSVSGNATITAIITYNDGTVNTHTLSTFQRIDHEIPQFAYYDHASQVTAGSVTPVTITLADRYNNRIDNRNTSEVHTLHISGLGSGESGFWDGSSYVPEIYLPTDAEGNVSVNVRVSTIVGYNTIGIAGIGNIPDKWPISIESVAAGDPVTITQVQPVPATWPADGEHTFNLYYSVVDSFGNPLDGTRLRIQSSTGESFFTNTSNGGIAYVSYGPKDVTGVYTITATSVTNSSIRCTDTGTVGYCSQNIIYYSQAPVDMILTASPQTLVSLDVDSASQSIVQARVVDVSGNPVSNQTVFFSNNTESYPGAPDGKYNITAESYITAPSAVTDSNGFATISFVPGRFPGIGELGYNATSTGRKSVTATWTNKEGTITKTGTVTFTWKNYPYLTVLTEVDKDKAKIGESLRLTITVTGNGAALQPKPIDVVIDMDRSGSMLENSTALEDNMVVAKSAATVFASCLTQSRDRIGIVSYGDNSATEGWVNLSPNYVYQYNWWTKKYEWAYNWDNVYGYWYWVARDSKNECGTGCDGYSSLYSPSSAHQVYLNGHYNNGINKYYGSDTSSVDLALGFNPLTDVNTALNGIVPGGGTPTRESIYKSVNQFPAYTPGRVRAIILQTDGEWNTGGNPEGGSGATSLGNGVGTGSVITYANTSKVALYVIGLGVSAAQETELRRYAANDAGQYYSASDASQLPEIYKQIAGDLNQQAGGSTALKLDLGTITVNGSVVSSYEYLNYTPIPIGGRGLGLGEPTDSTFVTMFHTNPDGSTTEYYRYTRDDSKNWTAASRVMDFSIGNMKLDDTWRTSMVFNLTKNGTLVLFGPDSGAQLSFTDSSTGITQSSALDSKTVSVYKSSVNEGFGTFSLEVSNLQITKNMDPHIWTVQWNTHYTGTSFARETVDYLSSEPGSQWTVLSERAAKSPNVLNTDSLQVDTRSWTPGETYTIRVTAIAVNDDAPPSFQAVPGTVDTTTEKTYIRLQ